MSAIISSPRSNKDLVAVDAARLEGFLVLSSIIVRFVPVMVSCLWSLGDGGPDVFGSDGRIRMKMVSPARCELE